jgi:arylsulfatase
MGTKATKKRNILVIWGDDIGWFNPSCYHQGLMGYRTPNIDRIAAEGARFTDWYGQQSCTAGRAAFITGQTPLRTGLTKVGLPGANIGLQPEDPTIADLLRPLGYVTGQFGKNHLGDRDEFLPTVHGFDEFFGNLYHLNAEEEPESPDYPKDPSFRKKFGPRGVIHSWANPDGTQKIEDTGPLTRKRMETVDDEFLEAALKFIDKAHKDGKPFFVWFNSTRMHVFTHLKKESEGVTGLGLYPDGMVEHDKVVGKLLAKLEELGILDDTVVMYSTDNGAEVFSWPDGGATPFRGEKDTNFEGGWRVPCVIRWPGVFQAGTISNDIFSHTDLLPTLVAAGGDPDIVEKLKQGHKVGKQTFKVHIDGWNMLPYWKGDVEENPRKVFFYWSDDGDLMAMRYEQWKVTFMEQRAHGIDVWREPLANMRIPKLFNLRSDPLERADRDGSLYYDRWFAERAYIMVPAQAMVGEYLKTFEAFPPRQRPASFSIDQAIERAREKQEMLAAAATEEGRKRPAGEERPSVH